MTIGIYGFFDVQTKECLYVGLSTDMEYRRKQHLKLLRGKRHRRKDFIEWWIAHEENESLLEFRILEECSEESLNAREIHWFKKLEPLFWGHEPSLNGKWRNSEETNKSISESHRRRHLVLGTNRMGKEFVCKNCQESFVRNIKKSQKYCSAYCQSEASLGFRKKGYKIEEILLMKETMSLREIAKIVGVSHESIRRALTFYNN